MKIDILTLFPEMFDGFLNASIIKRARDSGSVIINVHNFKKLIEGIDRYEGEGEKEDKQKQTISACKILFEGFKEELKKLEKYKNEKEYNYVCRNIFM